MNSYMIPNKLKKGDTIAIVAPSNPISEERRYLLDNAIDFLKKSGFNVTLSKNALIKDEYGVSAGTPEQRADEILDLIDYNLIKENPKIFMGMSDIDVLLMAINKKTGLITFNTSDPKMGRDLELDIKYSQDSFADRIIEGKSGLIKNNSEWKPIRKGLASGKIMVL